MLQGLQDKTTPFAARAKRSATPLADRLAVALLLLLALVAALTFAAYGLGWDDYAHAQYADLLLKLYGSGFSDRRALSYVNLFMYGGGFDMAAALMAKVLPFGLFETRRLAGAAVGLLGLFVTWRLGRRLGGPQAGLIALILLAANPSYYGQMFMNPKDGPFAAFMILLLLALVRMFEEYPAPARTTVVLFGTGLGLAIGSRVLGGIGALYAVPPFALIVASEMRQAGVRAALRCAGAFLLALLPGFVLGYLIMGLVWPWSVLAPLNPLRALTYFSVFFEQPWKEMFEGALISVPDMPWIYLPVLLALKLPEIVLAMGLAGAAGAFAQTFRRDRPITQRAALLSVALAVLVPLGVALVTHPALYNGIRHFTFLMPPLAVLGGLAGAWAFARAERIGRVASVSATMLFALGTALPVVEMVRLHPYQYAYFNTLAGGLRRAHAEFMVDYWGLSFRQASQQLIAVLRERHERKPEGRPWKIAVCGPHPPAQVVLGADFETTWDPKGADFAMMLGEFYCAQLDAPVLTQVVREGIAFTRVYDIRGRSITSLLTLPPP